MEPLARYCVELVKTDAGSREVENIHQEAGVVAPHRAKHVGRFAERFHSSEGHELQIDGEPERFSEIAQRREALLRKCGVTRPDAGDHMSRTEFSSDLE